MENGVSLVISGLILDSKHGALHKTIAYPSHRPGTGLHGFTCVASRNCSFYVGLPPEKVVWRSFTWFDIPQTLLPVILPPKDVVSRGLTSRKRCFTWFDLPKTVFNIVLHFKDNLFRGFYYPGMLFGVVLPPGDVVLRGVASQKSCFCVAFARKG